MGAGGSTDVRGGSPTFQRLVRGALDKYPSWLVRAARLSHVEVTNRADVRAQIAMYEHGSRVLYVWPGVGEMLLKAVGHELWHGADDRTGLSENHPHFFSMQPAWTLIHRDQPFFDIEKYEREPLEYFADQGVKLLLLGAPKLMTTNGREVNFFTSWVVPMLEQEFGR